MMADVDSGPVIVIGGLNIDTLAHPTGSGLDLRTSNVGVTHRSPGGVARNIAEALGRLGTPVRMVGAVGDDEDGRWIIKSLEDAGVDTSTVGTARSCASGSYTAIFDENGDLMVGVADTSVTERILPENLEPRWFKEASWVVLDGNLRRRTLARAVQLARENKVPTVLDPVSVAKAGRLGVLPGLHTFTATVAELNAWNSAADPVMHAHAQGISAVWVRRGAEGSTLYPADGTPIAMRLPAAEVVNATGAGDTSVAAYVHRLREGASLSDAGWFAATAGWLAVRAPEAVRPDLSVDLIEQTWNDLMA